MKEYINTTTSAVIRVPDDVKIVSDTFKEVETKKEEKPKKSTKE